MNTVMSSFGGEASRVDSNNDGQVSPRELKSGDHRDKMALKKMIGKDAYRSIIKGETVALNERNDAQADVTHRTNREQKAHRGEVTSSIESAEFTRTLKKGAEGEDVAALQSALKAAGYNPWTVDGKFGPGTDKALRAYQKQELGQSGDGVMELGGATMQSIQSLAWSATVLSIDENGNTYSSHESNETLWVDVSTLQALVGTTVDGKWGKNSQAALNKYIKWGKTNVENVQRIIGTAVDGSWGSNSQRALKNFTSNNGGHSELGRETIGQLRDIQEYLDAYNEVYGEQDKNGKVKLFSNNKGLLGIANQVISPNYKKLASQLGVSNDQVKEITGDSGINKAGLTRFATIAVVSAFVSGGSSLALELFGINIGKNFHKGPEVQEILKLMDARGNLHGNMRKLIISDKTTSKDVTGVLDELNNPSLLPANLRRFMKDIFQNKLYAAITGGWEDYKKARDLIDQFEHTNNTEGAKQILIKIYEIALKRLKRAERVVPFHKSRIEELGQALKWVGIESGRITSLDNKFDSIVGNDTSAERSATADSVTKEIGYTGKLTSISASKLDSKNAYGFKLPKNPSSKQLAEILTRMESTKVQWDKHSILANLVTGIRTNTGLPISVADFKKGFMSMKSLNKEQSHIISNKKVESNTGRTLAASFQGEVKSNNITAMTVNKSTIYFRGECTNVLVVNEPLQTTITSAKSIPVAIPVSISGGGTEWLVNSSRPEDGGEPVDLFVENPNF